MGPQKLRVSMLVALPVSNVFVISRSFDFLFKALDLVKYGS